MRNIIKCKAKFLDAYETSGNADQKRKAVSRDFTVIDSTVFEWFSRMRFLSIPVSGPMIQSKALSIAKELGIEDCSASSGWLHRFKTRHHISGNKISGEKASVCQDTIGSWMGKIPGILEGYQPKDIFNMDETGLFYCALPDKTLAVKHTDMSGCKKSKERLTASLCVNMEGEFEKTLVIGKSQKPRCFRNLAILRQPGHSQATWQSSCSAPSHFSSCLSP